MKSVLQMHFACWYQTILSCCLAPIDTRIHSIHSKTPTQTHIHTHKRIKLKDRDMYFNIQSDALDARFVHWWKTERIYGTTIPQNRDERLTSQAYAYIDMVVNENEKKKKTTNMCESNGKHETWNVQVRAQWDAFRFAMSL